VRVKQSQRDGTERNQPITFVFGDAYHLTYKGLTDEDKFTMPFDLSIRSYPPLLCEGTIDDIAEKYRILPIRILIEQGRRYLPQGFMWTDSIKFQIKFITSLLLDHRISCRRRQDAFLERTMHSFMPAILFWMSWIYTFRDDPQLDPPSRKWRKSTSADGSEWWSVISANSQGKPILAEDPLKYWPNMLVIRL
jgi:hypothetical protein